MNLLDKLTILSDAAKYDAACTSSGARRGYQEGKIGCTSTSVAGCCHTFSSDGRCVTLLKVLLSNDCCYNCKYCVNRCTISKGCSSPPACYARRTIRRS